MRLLILYLALTGIALGREPVSVRDFGATGDGITDDTDAIRAAFAGATHVHFPAGVYRITNGIDLPPSARITGDGSPTLGTFPILDDDKRFMTVTGLQDLPGTSLIFTGEGSNTCETGRSDEFASVRYALRTGTGYPFQISNLAIILDMAVVNNKGRLTSPENDKRADYDVGLLIDDSPGGSVHNVSVFGYWNKAGLLLTSRGARSNPDYNSFWNCRFSGNYGVALLGLENEGPGLSGSQFYGCCLFSADHHSRSAGHTGSGALYIDGHTKSKRANINGHYFFGGCIRTYHNTAVRLNRATNINFSGVVFEVPAMKNGDDTSNQTGKVIGTAETGDVSFFGCRMHDIGLAELGETMKNGNLTIAGNSPGGIEVHSEGRLVRINASGVDPLIQLSNEGDGGNDGWTIRSDSSEDNELAIRYNNTPVARFNSDGDLRTGAVSTHQLQLNKVETRRIDNAEISAGASRLMVLARAGDRLSTIKDGNNGDMLILERHVNSEIFTAITGETGNLQLTQPFTFDHLNDRITLLRTADAWVEIARSDFSPNQKSKP